MPQPTLVTRAFTTPPTLTLGHILWLEKVNSPVFDPTPRPAADWVESLYIITQSPADIDETALRQNAWAWVDTLTPHAYRQALNALRSAVDDFYAALPRPTDEPGQKKEPAQATEPSSPSPNGPHGPITPHSANS